MWDSVEATCYLAESRPLYFAFLPASETDRVEYFPFCFYFALFSMESFLAAFTKLRKATITFVMSVRPSVPMEQLGSHWTDIHNILYLKIFSKYCR